MPGAQLTTEGFGTVGAVASALVICAFAAGLHGWIPIPRLPTLGGGTPRACVAITLAAVVVFVAALSVKSGTRITRPAIVMLDVGQGDATLLLGAGGCSALIDGGPPGDGLAAKIRATGVRRLDAVLTTHPEDDHFGGILELAENGDLPVATLLDGGGNTDNARYAELRASFDKRGTRFEPAVAGTVWRCGDIAVTVIAPGPQAPDAPPPADPNTRAAVTKVDVGPLGMLASGDAESPQLLPLPLPSEPILKVPHHGSDDPGLPALLQRIRPSVALIGVGARNRFGHPTPATLGALEGAGAEVFRTDLQGELIVTPGSAGEPVVRVWRDG
jgi:competence protein ComEC